MCTAPQKVPTYITQNTGTLKKEMLKGSERRGGHKRRYKGGDGEGRDRMPEEQSRCLFIESSVLSMKMVLNKQQGNKIGRGHKGIGRKWLKQGVSRDKRRSTTPKQV